MCTPLCCTRDGHAGTCACTTPVCTVLHNGHAYASCVHHPLWCAQNLLGILQPLTVIHNQFPGQQQQPNMSDNATCCKRTPTCFCAICALLILVISAICIPLATQMMGSDPVIPSGRIRGRGHGYLHLDPPPCLRRHHHLLVHRVRLPPQVSAPQTQNCKRD